MTRYEIQTSNIKIQNKHKIPNPKYQTLIKEYGKVYNLRERLLIFSRRILEICKKLPSTPEGNKIREQLGSAGSSVGANFEEADGALTKKDFINKIGIARKEAKETKYWLRVIRGIYINENEIDKDIRESEEIINILSAILKKAGINSRK